MKTKLFLALVFLGIIVLAAGGFTVRGSRRALRFPLRPRGWPTKPARRGTRQPVFA